MGAFPVNADDSISLKPVGAGFQGGLSGGMPGDTAAPAAHFTDGGYTFAKLFCRSHRCHAENLEVRVLWHCLYHASSIPLAWLVLKFAPDYFHADFQMISEIKAATTHAQVREILADHHTEFLKKSFLRRRLKLRVSRTKLISLARAVLRSEF